MYFSETDRSPPANEKVRQLSSLTISLPESVMETSSVVLTFESVGEILWCDHSNETSLVRYHLFFNFLQNEIWDLFLDFEFVMLLGIKRLNGYLFKLNGSILYLLLPSRHYAKMVPAIVQLVLLLISIRDIVKGTLSRGRMRQFLESKPEFFKLKCQFQNASTSGGGHGGK